MDENLNTLYRSSSTARITGWKDEIHLENHITNYIHPDYLEYIKTMIQKSLKNPKVPVAISLKVKHQEGYYIWLEGVLNNRINDNNVNGIIVNLRDVTETKKIIEVISEEKNKFDKIAATSPGLIYSMRQNKDNSLSYIYASDAVEDIYGFSFHEISTNSEKIFNLIHAEDIQHVLDSISKTKLELIPLHC
ncbi:MAG: PAS domain-containing protein, partial [Flavobacterium sp.]|nr:PAS domain-containing protein [Flavobacterium sp.]